MLLLCYNYVITGPFSYTDTIRLSNQDYYLALFVL